jgi:hypothetical protein
VDVEVSVKCAAPLSFVASFFGGEGSSYRVPSSSSSTSIINNKPEAAVATVATIATIATIATTRTTTKFSFSVVGDLLPKPKA